MTGLYASTSEHETLKCAGKRRMFGELLSTLEGTRSVIPRLVKQESSKWPALCSRALYLLLAASISTITSSPSENLGRTKQEG